MDLITFEITRDDNNKSLIQWLQEFYISKKNINTLVENKLIMVNNDVVSLNTILQTNDLVSINLVEFENNNYLQYKKEIEILYEDEDILVVNKPTKILIHPDGFCEQTLGNVISFYYHRINLNRSIRHIHRLDFETSGCLIYAKHFLAQSFLEQQIENRLVKRFYTAICHGKVNQKEGTINSPIGRNRHRSGEYIVTKNGKEALTHYKLLKYAKGLSLLEIQIETGRTHQIRVHLNSVGHPIVGDKVYGKKENIRLMLHASKVEFIHPRSRQRIEVVAPLPKEFNKMW